jgi:hypothetical protein
VVPLSLIKQRPFSALPLPPVWEVHGVGVVDSGGPYFYWLGIGIQIMFSLHDQPAQAKGIASKRVLSPEWVWL